MHTTHEQPLVDNLIRLLQLQQQLVEVVEEMEQLVGVLVVESLKQAQGW
jgi:hypothetical protein